MVWTIVRFQIEANGPYNCVIAGSTRSVFSLQYCKPSSLNVLFGGKMWNLSGDIFLQGDLNSQKQLLSVWGVCSNNIFVRQKHNVQMSFQIKNENYAKVFCLICFELRLTVSRGPLPSCITSVFLLFINGLSWWSVTVKSTNRCAHSPDSHAQNYRNQPEDVRLDDILVIQVDFMRTQGMVGM